VSDAIGPGEAARRLGVSTRTVQRWLREGRLPSVQVGSRLKVDGRALDAGHAPGASATGRPIQRLFVANRGEIVVRIARTCRALGILSLAAAPPDQQGAWWTSTTDELVALDGSYLDGDALIAAARAAGADAIHPGYGFLAESAVFAEQVLAAGLTWVGPPPAAMRALGDKAAARQLAARAGISLLPGYDGDDQSDAALRRAAKRIGYPLLLKPSAGGGGKGMHVVRSDGQLEEALGRARREALAAFADDRLVIERHLERPRHVEVQLLLDEHGGAVHLGERECSLQRRHQKVIEEAPSLAVDTTLRARLGDAAISLARAGGYAGAGTAEFLLTADGSFYFLELNARLQVEHPVTELVTGRDLVADQLRIAAGEPLGFEQADVRLDGHAVEARLYAEDPWADFLPATGRLLDVRWPDGEGIRVDAGIAAGDEVGARYDPMLAKLVAHGADRGEALGRLRRAIDETRTLGVTTNRGFLGWLLEHPAVVGGAMDTELIERDWQPTDDGAPEPIWQAAAQLLRPSPNAGFRLNQPARLRLEIDGTVRGVALGEAHGSEPVHARTAADAVVLDADGRAVTARLASPPTVETALRRATAAARGQHSVAAPMPGQVLQLRVSAGDTVEAGQILLVLEAMKMENAVVAPAPARVESVLVEVGQQVQRGQPLVELA
jgi:acetyl-CoA/propionyl-CoA carboxylase biotin carboxyl carrier protein